MAATFYAYFRSIPKLQAMPIKKSAVVFILLAVNSIILVLLPSDSPPTEPLPENGSPTKCSSLIKARKPFSPWDMVSKLLLQSAT